MRMFGWFSGGKGMVAKIGRNTTETKERGPLRNQLLSLVQPFNLIKKLFKSNLV